MRSFTTPLITVATAKVTTGDGVFNALTPALNSNPFRRVRVSIDVQGRVNTNVCAGVIWSNDGITWNPAFAEKLAWLDGTANYKSDENWTWGQGYVDLDALTYEMVFLRFGVFALSTNTGAVRNANVRLRVDSEPVAAANTFAVGPLVISSGTGTSPVFYAMTGRIPTSDIAKVRAAWEMQFQTGNAETLPAWQTSADGVTWNTATALTASYLAANGYYVSTFESISLAGYAYVRFGMLIKTSSGGTRDMCQVGLRVDTRGA